MVMRLFVLLLLAPLLLPAQTGVDSIWERKMLDDIREAAKRIDGVVGMATIDLTSGRTVSFHGEAVFPQASAIKIPILIAMFEAAREGKFRLEDQVGLTIADAASGSGQLRARLEKGPLQLTVRELVTAMIETSDNTATNRSIQMAGMDRVNRLLDRLGLRHTRLRRIMMDLDAARRGDENVSTPLEMVDLVARLYRDEVAPAEDCRAMLDIMKRVKGGMRQAIPATVEIASKTGGIPGVRCETGIVYLKRRPFAISVHSTFLRSNEEKNPVEEITRVVYAYYERIAGANRYGHGVNP
jgi:beta-lactamase class A